MHFLNDQGLLQMDFSEQVNTEFLSSILLDKPARILQDELLMDSAFELQVVGVRNDEI